MYEYEYSKEVDDLKKIIDYCEKNDFTLVSKIEQKRIIYRHNGTMARITINDNNGEICKELDFKEDKLTSDELIVRKESLPIIFTDDKAVNSILEFLEYEKDNTLLRVRYNYVKNDVKFELDEYILPEKKYVVALEGEAAIADKLWKEIDI